MPWRKRPIQIEEGKVRFPQNRPQLGLNLSGQVLVLSVRHVDRIVSRHGQLAPDEFDQPPVVRVQPAQPAAVVDVVEIPDRRFTTGQRRPHFFGVRLPARQHRNFHG
jgi:hypothetical protein